jgi:hypothetical protein
VLRDSPHAVAGGAFIRTATGGVWFYDGSTWTQFTMPGGPADVTAAATAPLAVTITWTGNATSTYVVQRKASFSAAWSAVAGTPTFASGKATLVDNNVAANSVYLYRVVSNGLGSNADVATTFAFTDAVLGSKRALLAHLTQLSNAVNAVRAFVSLPAVTINTSNGVIRASHLEALRAGVLEAHLALGIVPPSITRAVAGAPMRAIDFSGIRNAVN